MKFWLFVQSHSCMPLILNGSGKFQVSIIPAVIKMFLSRQGVSFTPRSVEFGVHIQSKFLMKVHFH